MLKKIGVLLLAIGISQGLFFSKGKVEALEPKIFTTLEYQNYKAKNPFKDVSVTSNYYKSTHILRDLSIINGYTDGEFKPNETINRLQAATLIKRLEENGYIGFVHEREGVYFNDTLGAGTNSYIGLMNLYRIGALQVDKENNISPGKNLTRAEMAKILVKAFNLDISKNTGSFKDVSNKTLEPYIETLLAYGITTGYNDGTFKPNNPITRAHYTEFIFRILNGFGEDIYVGDRTQVVNDNVIKATQTRWPETVKSFIVNSDNNIFTTVDVSKDVIVQTYSNEYQLLSTKKLPVELPLFGTFYSGDEFNYIAFGQENKEENNKEVIRIVKYDKDFNRLDSLSIKGSDIHTTIPFDAAVGRMEEENGQLVYHTSRERYKSEDGVNHQSQLTFVIDTNTMQVLNNTSLFQKNHVGHSFNQFVLFDDSEHVLLDHGDGYPRALVLHKGSVDNYQEKIIVNMPGVIGDNNTGVSVGGFEQSTNNYLILYNQIDREKAFLLDDSLISIDSIGVDSDIRDIKIAAVSKDLSNVSINELANYTGKEKQMASVPKLVEISEDEFVVLWNEYSNSSVPKYLKYVKINGEGQAISKIQIKERVYLSSMQPVYVNGKISWYVNQANTKYFFSLDVSNL